MKAAAFFAGLLGTLGHARTLASLAGGRVAVGLASCAAMLDRALLSAASSLKQLSRLVPRQGGWPLPSNLSQVLALVLFVTLVASGFGIISNAGRLILRNTTESVGRAWAQYVALHIPELPQILAGAPVQEATRAMISRIHGSGDVFRVEFYDLDGVLRLQSELKDKPSPQPNDVDETRKGSSDIVRTGVTQTKFWRAGTSRQPIYIAEVAVPLYSSGHVTGMLEVYMDVTQTYGALYDILTSATISFGLILVLAFGLPGIGYWMRTRQKEHAESQLHFLTQHDSLTKLENRTVIMQRLEAALGRSSAARVAVLSLDLDRFTDINAALGHDAGDQLLKAIAERLNTVLNPNEHLARVGGDEFMIVQEFSLAPNSAVMLAERLQRAFQKPFEIEEKQMRIGPSIGIALGPDDGAEAEVLVRNANLALRSVKLEGRGAYRVYVDGMERQSVRRRFVSDQVRAACENNGFQLHFQPVFSLTTGLLAGFEALVRLPSADGTMVPPSEFIPAAEELGLITKIGTWVLETACRRAAEWPDDLTVAVNISPAEFREGKIVERAAAALKKSGLNPERLEIEVTEGVLLANSETTSNTVDGLKKLGVSIVLDDFGTGYSSLSYLWQFRFDKLKIDQSFVRAIGKNDNVPDIIRTIVALGRALDVRVTAEGVESEAQAALLKSMRCDLVQGYLYGTPEETPDVPALINRPLPRSLAASAIREPGIRLVSG